MSRHNRDPTDLAHFFQIQHAHDHCSFDVIRHADRGPTLPYHPARQSKIDAK